MESRTAPIFVASPYECGTKVRSSLRMESLLWMSLGSSWKSAAADSDGPVVGSVDAAARSLAVFPDKVLPVSVKANGLSVFSRSGSLGRRRSRYATRTSAQLLSESPVPGNRAGRLRCVVGREQPGRGSLAISLGTKKPSSLHGTEVCDAPPTPLPGTGNGMSHANLGGSGTDSDSR